MTSLPEQSEQGRAPYRPPAGMPLEREGRWGWPVSIFLHALIIGLLLIPAMATGVIPSPLSIGAGGPGDAGGGGGGRGLKGILPERLRFLHVAPAPTPTPRPEVAPPVPPVTTPPIPQPNPEPVPEPAKRSAVESAPAEVASAAIGEGTGGDGTDGAGPGSGGGVGSGFGTGRGSGIGPGTGGGDGTIYPPSPTQLLLPPIPIPKELSGVAVEVYFDVDSTGRVLSVDFSPTRNRSYNSKLRERLNETRFRPATRHDGTPVRARVPITLTL